MSSEVDEMETVGVAVVRIVPALARNLVSGAVRNEALLGHFVAFNVELPETEEPVVAGEDQDELARVSGLEGERDRLLLGVFQLNVDLLRNVVLSETRFNRNDIFG